MRAGPGAFERPFETQRRQVTPNLVLGDLDAEHLSHAHGAQGNLLAGDAYGPGIQHAGRGGAACQLEDEARGATTGEVGRLDVRAALEPVAGVGAQPEGLAGAADVDGVEPGSLDEDVGGVGLDAGVGPAHDAGEGDALISVGDQEHLWRELAGDAVEGGEGLALGGAADDDGGDAVGVAGEEAKVEGVERLPGLEHHQVGNVHDVVDGAEADHGEACLEPAGAGPHADAAQDARGIAMAGLGGVDADGELLIDRGGVGGHRVGGFEGAQGVAGQRGDLTGDADDGVEVGAVGRDLEVEDDVGPGAAQVGGEGLAGEGLGPEDEESILAGMADGVGVDAELVGGAHHAMGLDAADLADLDGEGLGVAGLGRERGSGKDEGNLVAGLEVLGSADDLALALSIVDAADGKAVGVGMGVPGKHMGDDDALELGGACLDALDFKPEHGEAFGEVGGRPIEVHEFLEPIEGDFHGKQGGAGGLE
ncbi:MAG: hypothetical protein RL153_121, partial [Verrucomicrobiota bacterium]